MREILEGWYHAVGNDDSSSYLFIYRIEFVVCVNMGKEITNMMW